MNAILTCVDYDDCLKVTLPRNVGHFSKVLVVTSLKDKKTQRLVKSYHKLFSYASSRSDGKINRLIESHGKVICYPTDAFYEEGTKFNKGRALEEGFDVLGREGWIMVMDADVILPEKLVPGPWGWEIGKLYSPHRRLCVDPGAAWSDWGALPYGPEKDVHPEEFAGYCQVFHALDPRLGKRPWYPLDRPTAQWCDSDFWRRWPAEKRIRPQFEVLHLGPLRENWEGRKSPRWGGQ